MPGQTQAGWPYPVGSDATHDYPSTGKALADMLQDRLGNIQSGKGQVDSAGNATVTFTRPFTAAPVIVATITGSSVDRSIVVNAGATSTGFSVTALISGSPGGPASFSWIAIGA